MVKTSSTAIIPERQGALLKVSRDMTLVAAVRFLGGWSGGWWVDEDVNEVFQRIQSAVS